MLFRELNRGKCKTYLLACEETREAAIVDPVKDRVDRYVAAAAYHGLRLRYAIDTHTHADHRSGTWDLADLVDAEVVMHRRAPAPHVGRHVDDGDRLTVGRLELRILATPGHTPDGLSIYASGRVLTGDTLLIHGTGRADFAGGDPGEQWDAITEKLFRLPDETLVFPAHDYRGHTQSTIFAEKLLNPRLAGKTRAEYVDLMNHLALPLPDKMQEALQPNQTAIEDGSVEFPTYSQLSDVRQLSPAELAARLAAWPPPLLVDVRENDEFSGELGHIAGSRLIPLRDLAARACELADARQRDVVCICRAGVRSTTAAAILTGLGFENVRNLRGGMLDWNDQGFPVERIP